MITIVGDSGRTEPQETNGPLAKAEPLKSDGPPILEGHRHTTLTRLAEAMRRLGCYEQTIGDALLAENARRCVPPLDPADVAAIAGSVSRFDPTNAQFLSCNPRENGLAGNDSWEPIPITELVEDAPMDWLWENFIFRNSIVLFSGVPKAGKSTLVAHLLLHMKDGGDLAGVIEPTRVLVVSEEMRNLWRLRRDSLGLQDNIDLVTRPFKATPSYAEWNCLIDRIERLVRERGYELVVFDTLAAFNPSPDENDSSKMQRALAPLRSISEAGAAVLLVHHLRKSDGGEGQRARGTSGLPGFCDVMLELKRPDGTHGNDRRRALKVYSRLVNEFEVILELTDEGYQSCGSRADAQQASRFETIKGILGEADHRLTVAEVRAAWPGGTSTPSERTVRNDLSDGANTGLWARRGAGVKGDPHQFTLA